MIAAAGVCEQVGSVVSGCVSGCWLSGKVWVGINIMKKKILGMILLLLALLPVATADDNVLYLYDWTDYIPASLLDKFTQETGIKIIGSTYDSNEEMFEALSVTGGNGYDLVVPSGYYVGMMAAKKLLQPIDRKRLHNYVNLDPALLGNNPEYGVAYCWGTTLLLVDSSKIAPATVNSWNDLLKPEFAGKTLFVDDLRDAFSVALYALGYSINTQERAEIVAAYDWLRQLLPGIKLLDSESIISELNAGAYLAAVVYGADVLTIQKERPEYKAIYPREGVPLWVDCFAIPRGAKHVDSAYKFIDFMLREDVSRVVVDEIMYSTPNKVVLAGIDEKLRLNRVFNPTPAELGKSVFIDYVGKTQEIYERYWRMLRQE